MKRQELIDRLERAIAAQKIEPEGFIWVVDWFTDDRVFLIARACKGHEEEVDTFLETPQAEEIISAAGINWTNSRIESYVDRYGDTVVDSWVSFPVEVEE